jgi:hypothetical protein
MVSIDGLSGDVAGDVTNGGDNVRRQGSNHMQITKITGERHTSYDKLSLNVLKPGCRILKPKRWQCNLLQGGAPNWGKNVMGPLPPHVGGLWRAKVVLSEWQLSQHWLLYGGMVCGGVATEKNACRQNIALNIYAGKHPAKIMEGSRRQQEHCVRSSNVS